MTATISMDPRIRARRDEVAAENDRRRSVRLLTFLAGLTLVIGVAASTRSTLLDVDEVAVSGADRTSADDIRRVSGIRPGDPLTDIDLGAARSAIAALPWVDSVTSERRWDGTVVFEISERTAVAQVVTGDESPAALVDAEGRVLARRDEPVDGLVAISEAPGSLEPGGWLAASALDAVEVASRLPSGLAEHVDELRVAGSGDITLMAADVGEVVLGTSIDLDLKFTALATMLDQVDMSCVAVLDLQVPTVPVLTRRTTC